MRVRCGHGGELAQIPNELRLPEQRALVGLLYPQTVVPCPSLKEIALEIRFSDWAWGSGSRLSCHRM